MLVPTGVWILPESHPSKGVAPGSKNLISSALGPQGEKVARICFPSGGQEHGVFSWEPQHSPSPGA